MSRIPPRVVTFIIGSACSGKSTLAGYMGRKGHGVAIRTSEEMKKLVAEKFPGKTIQDFIGEDQLVHLPNIDDGEYLMKCILAGLATEDRLVVDGYPRNLHQSFIFEETLKQILDGGHVVRVIDLKVPLNELLKRMNARNRQGDTESRIIFEEDIHGRISHRLRTKANSTSAFTYAEVHVGADSGERKVELIGDKGKKELAFMDLLAKRVESIFSDIEYKKANLFPNVQSAAVVTV